MTSALSNIGARLCRPTQAICGVCCVVTAPVAWHMVTNGPFGMNVTKGAIATIIVDVRVNDDGWRMKGKTCQMIVTRPASLDQTMRWSCPVDAIITLHTTDTERVRPIILLGPCLIPQAKSISIEQHGTVDRAPITVGGAVPHQDRFIVKQRPRRYRVGESDRLT